MRYPLTVVITLALLGAATAAGTDEAAPARTGGSELGIAALNLERAIANYNTDYRTCQNHLYAAISALWDSPYIYDELSRESEFIASAIEYLEAVNDLLSQRRAVGYSPSPEEVDSETAMIQRIANDLYALERGETSTRPVHELDYEKLREEVKANKAAGKGDIETQIDALRAEATRLNEEADALEAENLPLEDKVIKVKKAVDFWKTIIGEDHATIPYR